MTYGFTRDPAPQRARKERKASFLFRRTAEEAVRCTGLDNTTKFGKSEVCKGQR